MAKELRESVRDARLREAERLLQQERLGLDAIATVVLQLTPQPERLMERLDRMAATAIENDLSSRTRDVIIFGQQLFRRRLERHLLRQQELLPRDEPELLADDHPDQPSLFEPVDLHGAQAAAEREMKERVLTIYRNVGALSDPELANHYKRKYGGATSREAIYAARVALKRQGLVYNRGGNDWIWDLSERSEA